MLIRSLNLTVLTQFQTVDTSTKVCDFNMQYILRSEMRGPKTRLHNTFITAGYDVLMWFGK